MSKAPSLNADDIEVPSDDPEEIVEEHRDLLERVAAADVTISPRVQRVLDRIDSEEGDGDE